MEMMLPLPVAMMSDCRSNDILALVCIRVFTAAQETAQPIDIQISIRPPQVIVGVVLISRVALILLLNVLWMALDLQAVQGSHGNLESGPEKPLSDPVLIILLLLRRIILLLLSHY